MLHEIKEGKEQESFKKIAKQLINEFNLMANGTEVELCDLEFYWNSGKVSVHFDQSTHEHSYGHAQLRPHDSGCDITLVNNNGRGGILIRGILINGVPTYGPLRSRQQIFMLAANLEKGFELRLQAKEANTNFDVHSTRRVGLNPKGAYYNTPYRFIRCSGEYLYKVDGKEALCKEIEGTLEQLDPRVIQIARNTPKRVEKV